jgi:hypothetical protein
MPDIRTLLDETTRRTPHPDPVTAVHAAVRSRARRRTTAVSAGAALAVAGGAVVAARDPRPARVVTATSPMASATRSASPTVSPTPIGKPATAEEKAFVTYVRARPERYDMMTTTYDRDDERVYLLAIGSDADPEAERRDLAASFPGIRFDFLRCAHPIPFYRTILAEADATTWPSGGVRGQRKAWLTIRLPEGAPQPTTWDPASWSCRVHVSLRYIGTRDMDIAHARERWGDDVLVGGLAPFTEGEQPVVRGANGALDPRAQSVVDRVAAHPEAYLGSYLDGDRLVAVLGRVDVYTWANPIMTTMGRLKLRIDQCQWNLDELEAVKDALATFDYPSGQRPAFGAHVDLKTCSTLMQTGDLPDEDEAALREEFGKKLTIDQSGAPRRD